MGGRVATFDWSSTPLGAIETWPHSLRAAVAICLHSRFQMAIYWGPELICIYNDAERDILGNLHPAALGTPARELLRDSWHVLEPELTAVMQDGRTTFVEDRPLSFDRRGLLEVGYFTYSYSPIADDHGGIGGVLLVSQETTGRVLAERRMDTLRELAAGSMDVPTDRRACVAAAHTLSGHPDVPFCLLYLVDERGEYATCAAATPTSRVRHPRVKLGRDGDDAAAVLGAAVAATSAGTVAPADLFVAAGPRGARRAFVQCLRPGAIHALAGFLVTGISEEIAFDDAYEGFFELVALGVGRTVNAARSRQADRERALHALLADLQAAHGRVAAAGDAERRRIERDLHDGAQQRLMALRLELGLLAERADDHQVVTRAELDRLREEVEGALEELREVAHGLHPPLLASDGLFAALTAVARRSPMPVELDGADIGRHAPAVESAAYFCCLEALQNVVKHAGPGARAAIRLEERHGALAFSVTDDGKGFDQRAVSKGHGLTNLRDRLGALGGRAQITSIPGRGTTVVGEIPLPSAAQVVRAGVGTTAAGDAGLHVGGSAAEAI